MKYLLFIPLCLVSVGLFAAASFPGAGGVVRERSAMSVVSSESPEFGTMGSLHARKVEVHAVVPASKEGEVKKIFRDMGAVDIKSESVDSGLVAPSGEYGMSSWGATGGMKVH